MRKDGLQPVLFACLFPRNRNVGLSFSTTKNEGEGAQAFPERPTRERAEGDSYREKLDS